jgi:tRNA dimethylallyltransferase
VVAGQAQGILLMGPTAAGKSAVAMALAAELGGEIVSVDSAQVYRGMDVGTAKPAADERARVPHHLLDIVDPVERYSAARFVADAETAIAAIRTRGSLPILAGGTLLYFKALTDGLSALPQADAAVRAALDARAAREGWPSLHAELARVDPRTAARLAPNDAQRIQRALEVFTLAGMPLSALQAQRRPSVSGSARRRWLSIALIPSDRARLHGAIATRFDAMLAAGLVHEVTHLRKRYALSAELPSMRAVGYRQAWMYIDGLIDAGQLRDQGIAATRQLAKRQFTWLRSTPAHAIDPYAGDAVAKALALTRLARA